MQKFRAKDSHEFANGAVGWAPGGCFDCLGPYAKVQNCPVEGHTRRYTCYATGYADTFFSVPAATRIKGKYIRGYFTVTDGAITFIPTDRTQSEDEAPL